MNISTTTLIFWGTISVVVGLIAGFTVVDLRLHNGLKVALKSTVRIVRKTIARVHDPKIDFARVQRDKDFIARLPDEKVGLADAKAIEVVSDFKQRLEQHYGRQLTAVYLFGSRARGDCCPDSDVDVAVFLAIDLDRSPIKKIMLHHTSELLLKYGLYVQPRIFESKLLEKSRICPDQYLSRAILGCGILI
jgi:predicted nucleotidyltransferase